MERAISSGWNATPWRGRSIGRSGTDDLRLLWAEVDESHPFVQHEMLMPVLGVVRTKDVSEAIACAKRVDQASDLLNRLGAAPVLAAMV